MTLYVWEWKILNRDHRQHWDKKDQSIHQKIMFLNIFTFLTTENHWPDSWNVIIFTLFNLHVKTTFSEVWAITLLKRFFIWQVTTCKRLRIKLIWIQYINLIQVIIYTQNRLISIYFFNRILSFIDLIRVSWKKVSTCICCTSMYSILQLYPDILDAHIWIFFSVWVIQADILMACGIMQVII